MCKQTHILTLGNLLLKLGKLPYVASVQHKRLGGLIAALALGLIGVATLIPLESPPIQRVRTCILCGQYGASDFVLNVALFAPFGAGLWLAGLSRRVSLVLATMVTLAIEALQLQLISGRDASFGDLLANVLGAAAGIMAASSWRSWLLPHASRAIFLACTAAMAWLGTLAGTAWALQRSVDTFWGYYGSWAPQSHEANLSRGLVLSATLNGKPLANQQIRNFSSLREDLLRQRVSLEATIVPGPQPDGSATIASLSALGIGGVVSLSRAEDDLVFRIRMRANDFLLRSPAIRLDDAFESASHSGSDTMMIAGGIDSNRLFVEMQWQGSAARRELRLSPNLGWAFFQPLDTPMGSYGVVLTSAWIIALLFPIAYWMARGKERVGRSGGAALLLFMPILSFVAVPRLFHLPPVSVLEWVSALAGMAAGWTVGSWTDRVRHID